MRIMIACGGTGGHLFPGLAVAEALRTRQHQVRLLVSEKAVDRTALAPLTNSSDPSAQLEVQPVPAVGYEGLSRLIRFCSRLAKATRGCAAAYDKFEPDVVLGMGGFTSVPALVAARWFRQRGNGDRQLPVTMIHESNAVPGKANRWAGRFTDGVAVGLSECARFFRRQTVTVTGTPIRTALRQRLRQGGQAAARQRLRLPRCWWRCG